MWIQFLVRAVAVVVALYAFLALYAYVMAERIIFQPPSPSYDGDAEDLVFIPVAEEERIAALHLRNPDASCAVLFSHGNAEDLGHVRPYCELMRRQGFDVLAYDYRGYGLSDGHPGEDRACQDILAAYDYLRRHFSGTGDDIILLGRSVGAGPSLFLAEREPVGGLVLESAFTSALRVVTQVRILPFDYFPNLERLKRIRCPVLVMHGRQDRIVPISHGKTLYRHVRGPKFHLWVSGAGHNDFVFVAGEDYWRALADFAGTVCQPTAAESAGSAE